MQRSSKIFLAEVERPVREWPLLPSIVGCRRLNRCAKSRVIIGIIGVYASYVACYFTSYMDVQFAQT